MLRASDFFLLPHPHAANEAPTTSDVPAIQGFCFPILDRVPDTLSAFNRILFPQLRNGASKVLDVNSKGFIRLAGTIRHLPAVPFVLSADLSPLVDLNLKSAGIRIGNDSVLGRDRWARGRVY